MGKNIDLTKKLSKEDEQWLRDRSRGWEVDEAKRRQEAGNAADGGEKPESEWEPPNRGPAEPFDEPGESPRQVPRPVGREPELDSPDAEVEEVAVEDLTVEELKEELHARDLPVSGNKDELVKRLKKAEKEDK